ncbi:putative DNA binding domain-containing protein, partial [bacterium]|nr:putative DNA binding domain-containing protein [bacterium]
MNLKALIKEGESETLELKESMGEWKEEIHTISAFANTLGGRIIIGVSKSGKLLGVEIGKDTVERLTNKISQNTDPKVHPRITTEKINSKSIIVIEVKESSDHLVLAFGRPYKRVGKSTVRMSKDEYERLILEKHKDKFQLDKQICKETSLKDIDWGFVKKEEFIPLYEKISERKTVGAPQSLLESLGCIKGEKPTNAGILLLGKDPQEFFMNAYIALARYKGKEVGIERLDYKEFNGNLFQQIDSCDGYIKEHVAVMSKLLPYQVQRQDIPEYGLFSIRELITNAVCHRDYENQHTKVIIKMFSDKMEFYNPGGLPEDITPANITEKQYSRNPIIAKVLAKVKYIEELGEGWNKIIKEHKTHPLKPKMPRINSDKYTSLVTIFSTRDKFEKRKIMEVNDRQRKAIGFLKEKGKITNREYVNLFRRTISEDTALNDLKDMVRKGIISIKRKGRSS